MGYYSTFNLKLKDAKTLEPLDQPTTRFIIAEFRRFSPDADLAMDDDGNPEGSWKAHDLVGDLVVFSEKWPGGLFELHRKGEDRDDDVISYVVCGVRRDQKAEVVFPPFDYGSLKGEVKRLNPNMAAVFEAPVPERAETTPLYWDCECEHNYIHFQAEERCKICKAERDESPDSRVDEVKKLFHVEHVRGDESLVILNMYGDRDHEIYGDGVVVFDYQGWREASFTGKHSMLHPILPLEHLWPEWLAQEIGEFFEAWNAEVKGG